MGVSGPEGTTGDGPGTLHAADSLLPRVYRELRLLAESQMRREPSGHTLQPTALVHEAYLRLVGDEDPGWSGAGHFFGAAATAMRRILVERARRKRTAKRGAGAGRVDLDESRLVASLPSQQLLALDEALDRLEQTDARAARIVLLRYFAGRTIEETAQITGVSAATVSREWTFARAWLYRELTGADTTNGSG